VVVILRKTPSKQAETFEVEHKNNVKDISKKALVAGRIF